jgi:6-pyruvoyl-tetrahydropterin synthase related domain
MHKFWTTRGWQQNALFLACVIMILAPLILRGNSCGQDFDFHFESWMGVVQHWDQGVFCPHWLDSANYGAGEPRFVFYPPLSWLLGAILGINMPWTWTPTVFIAVCLFGMEAACCKMAREWMPDQNARIAACLYVINPYILFVIYERGALAEFLAAVWLPLLVLYALRRKSSVLQLALIIAAIWLTNAPAAVMGSYTLAVIVVVAAIAERRWTLIIRAAAGMALGLGLATVYLIPAIYEQRWVEITRAIGPGLRIQDSFLFEHTGMAYHDLVLRAASSIAVSLLFATAVAAILYWRKRKQQTLRNPLLILAALITFLLFPASRIIWDITPELRFLQFPWRWLLFLGLIFATFTAGSLGDSFPTRRTKILRAAAVLALATVLISIAWRHYWQFCDDQDNIHAQIATAQLSGFEGTDEYTPKDADNGAIQQNLAPVRILSTPDGDAVDSSIDENPDWQPNEKDLLPAIVQIKRWQVEHMTAEVQSPQPGYAVLRVMDYPAWQVYVNSKPAPRLHRDDGLLALPIPSGTSTIDVRYIATPDVWAGRAVSLVSLLIWIALWLAQAAKTRRQNGYHKANASRTSD